MEEHKYNLIRNSMQLFDQITCVWQDSMKQAINSTQHFSAQYHGPNQA
jgi:hypothetical protein